MKTTKHKAVVAALGALLTAVGPMLADGIFDGNEYAQAGAAALGFIVTVYGVYRVKNKPVPVAGTPRPTYTQ